MRDTLRTARTADDDVTDARRVSQGTPGFAYIVAPFTCVDTVGVLGAVNVGRVIGERRHMYGDRAALLSLN